MSTPYSRARPRSESHVRVEQLLDLYPDLSERELAELIHLFPHLDMISRGMMAADDRFGGKIEDFYRQHGSRLDLVVPPRTSLFAAAMFGLLLILWLILR